MNDDTFRPTECQVERRDRLVCLVGQALDYSGELALPVASFQRVTRVAVDVTYGDASDADLRDAAEACLRELDHMVECVPLRNALKKAIDQIGDDTPAAPGGVTLLPELDNALDPERDAPRKEASP